jgi:tRNA-dihydrouridine synthase B
VNGFVVQMSVVTKSCVLKPLKIGSVEIPLPFLLAPMSGVTNSAFRRLIKELNPGAVGLVVTEFISVEGLTRNNEQSLRMMDFREMERPISIQIFGSDANRLIDAAQMVEETGANIVDINCGCPVPKVVKRGGGCELMRKPEHLGKILAGVRNAVKIPLTVKIRAGWDSENRNAVEVARAAEDSGVDMITVHGRTRQDLYRGDADWQMVSAVAGAVKVPVIGSGDIQSFESALARTKYGAAGLMIGRGALSNPWIFGEMLAGFNGEQFINPSLVATVDVLERYLELLLEDMPERGAIGKMKQFASQVTRRVHGAAETRRAICSCSTLAEMKMIFDSWRTQLEIRQQNGGGLDREFDTDSRRVIDSAESTTQIAL